MWRSPWLGHFPSGARVTLTTGLAAGQALSGRGGLCIPTAEFTPKSRETPDLRTHLVYRLRIVVQDPDSALLQGMPVTVQAAAMNAAIQPTGLTKRFRRAGRPQRHLGHHSDRLHHRPGRPDGPGKEHTRCSPAGWPAGAGGREIRVLGLDPVREGDAPRQRLSATCPSSSGLYEDLNVQRASASMLDLRGAGARTHSPPWRDCSPSPDLARFHRGGQRAMSGDEAEAGAGLRPAFGTPDVLLLDEPGSGRSHLPPRLWQMVRRLG